MFSSLFAASLLLLPTSPVDPAVSSAFAADPIVTSPAAASGELDDLDLDIDFEALGKSVLARAGLEDVPQEELAFEQILDSSFVTIRLGLFDLGMSAQSAADKMKADEFVDLAEALLTAQEGFLDWLGPKAPDVKDARKDIKTLKSWLKGLRGDVIAGIGVDQVGELSELLRTKETVLKAQERFGDYMARGIPLGLDREDQMVEPFILAPDRREFMEMLSVFGLLLPDQQSNYWTNEAALWTNTYFNDVKLVALQFADLGSSTAGAFGGISMNSRSPSGMEQQITQLAGNSLIDNLFGDKIPPSLAGALAVNLVTDVYGECNTRVDGDLRSRRTEAREIFVPGGQSEGGILPPNMADSRWRTEQGSDRFTNSLKAAQSAGKSEAKSAAERDHCFEIRDDRESSRMTLKAPFLGTVAAERELVFPDAFYGDSLEFFRSYRSSFVFWMMTEGGKSKKKSGAAFAKFLTTLAQSDVDEGALEEAIREIYGCDLSGEQPSKKDLEGRFLNWLGKQ